MEITLFLTTTLDLYIYFLYSGDIARGDETKRILKTHFYLSNPDFEKVPIHKRLRDGCKKILHGAKRLEMTIETANYSIQFSINHPADMHSCYLNVLAENNNFKAELPMLREATITNNGFDVADNEGENKKLLGYLHDIYNTLFPKD